MIGEFQLQTCMKDLHFVVLPTRYFFKRVSKFHDGHKNMP